MNETSKSKEAEYPLIPMSEIRDEPRRLAVAWHENATDWIGDKHKLASDIQNYAEWQSATLQSRITQLEKLFDFVFNLNGMTTKEFCDAYQIELPSWKGNVTLAASEFIRLDAIKWNMVKDAAKKFYTPLTADQLETEKAQAEGRVKELDVLLKEVKLFCTPAIRQLIDKALNKT